MRIIVKLAEWCVSLVVRVTMKLKNKGHVAKDAMDANIHDRLFSRVGCLKLIQRA
jgi:hypothetical protein